MMHAYTKLTYIKPANKQYRTELVNDQSDERLYVSLVESHLPHEEIKVGCRLIDLYHDLCLA